MKFAIIAAGEGSRLINEGIGLPKPLVEVNGVPMIERLIRIAKDTGFDSVSCIINDHSPELKEFLMSNDFGIPLNLKILCTPSSMHSLFELSGFLSDAPFCLTTADSIFDSSEFSRFAIYAKEKVIPLTLFKGGNREKVEGLVAITKFIDDEKPLYVKVDNNNVIESFSDENKSEWVTGGIYCFSPKIFKEVETALELNIMRLRNFLRLLITEKYVLEGYPFSKIIDVDHASDIAKAEKFLEESSRKGRKEKLNAN